MQILSALDAISPAFSRTKLILFSPFRKGRTWKLAATGYLAAAGTAFLPFPLIYLAFIPMARQSLGPWAAWAILGAVLLFTALYLWLFYLCSRLRFAFFDICLNRGEFVAPAWRKYGPPSFRWFLVKVALGTLLTAILAAPTIAYSRHMFTLFASLPPDTFKPGQPASPEFMNAIVTFYASFALIYLVIGLFFVASSLTSDFVVPSLALEDTTLAEAFTRLGKLLRNEPGQILLYALLKFSLAIVLYMAGAFALEIAFLLVLLVIGLVAGLLWFLLTLLHIPTMILIGLGILLGIACYVFFIYCVFILAGALSAFLESYTLYFLGGRYPMLGDLLTASTPPRPIPPPPPAYASPYLPPPETL